MNDEVQFILDHAEERMSSAISHLDNELAHIRAGKANPRMLDGVTVDYYGAQTPLSQVSNITTPDPRTIAVQPWEKPMIPIIEKAILTSNLGFNPDNNGEIIRINIPPLTEERRRDLMREVGKVGESAKVGIRAARKDANDSLKKMVKDGLSEDAEKNANIDVQDMTDKFSKQVDEKLKVKEEEIMTV
ncbi:ribosome recycling factor [Puteibacter caeruleilacunae]|nr:ribosome recycling factor [Puteibacter caeruleilacunae]